MTKQLIVFFIIACFVGSCAPTVVSPTQMPIAIGTSTNPPIPTPFVTPTITPYPSLQTRGPYLLYTENRNEFTIMDADGVGRKQFQLPNDGYIGELEPAVSPDGKWLAYFTGSNHEPYDLSLHVINLSNETSAIVAHLMAPGYPENLRPVAESLVLSDYHSECPHIECLTELTSTIFQWGIRSFAWSPDGRFLAFAAQIDGPSSDIYLYDIESQIIRRLTDEIENIWGITWYSNGEKIVYYAVVPGPVDPYEYWYIADPDINSLQHSMIDYGDHNPTRESTDVSFSTPAGTMPETKYTIIEDLEPLKTFLGQDEKGQFYGVSPDGEVKLPGSRPSISPNKKWILIWETDTKLNLYSGEFNFVNSWSFAIDRYVKAYGVIWRPDSLGVILKTSAEYCYYLSIPDGRPELRNTGALKYFIWLP